MNWVFYALFGAAILHLIEEYVYPGGFPAFMKAMAPAFAPFVTSSFAVVSNGVFLLLCLAAALVGREALIFSLSIASLCGVNGLVHVVGMLRARQYAPGVVTGALLYLPLAVLAYYLSIRSGELSVWPVISSIFLGLVYQAIPLGTLWLARALQRTSWYTR